MKHIIIVGALGLLAVLQSASGNCDFVRCKDPGCQNPVSVPDNCCPICPICVTEDGTKYKPGDIVPNNDPCKHCRCQDNGKIVCVYQDCAPPACTNSVRVDGKCCPVCPKPGYCIAKDGTWYKAGDPVPSPKPCEVCKCGDDSVIHCKPIKCPPLACKYPISVEGKCCPVCPPPDVCVKDGVKYEVGQIVPSDNPCLHCVCHETGKIECFLQDCPRPPCDNPIREPGQCCRTCPKIEAEDAEPVMK